MKILKLNDRTVLVRHWLVWYYVDRSGGRWQKLKPVILNGSPPRTAKNILDSGITPEKARKELAKRV